MLANTFTSNVCNSHFYQSQSTTQGRSQTYPNRLRPGGMGCGVSILKGFWWTCVSPYRKNSELEQCLTPHQHNLHHLQRRFTQSISWLILKNKTVKENTQTKYNLKSKQHKIQQTKLPRFSCLLRHSSTLGWKFVFFFCEKWCDLGQVWMLITQLTWNIHYCVSLDPASRRQKINDEKY